MNNERHGMIPGSHENQDGPECRCGAEWDFWLDICARPPGVVTVKISEMLGAGISHKGESK